MTVVPVLPGAFAAPVGGLAARRVGAALGRSHAALPAITARAPASRPSPRPALGGGLLLAGAASLLGALLGGSASARGRRRRPQQGSTAVRVTEGDVLAEARAAAEAAKLELQAAKLRAEAEELERAGAVQRRAARARRLLGGEEGGVSVGADDLRVRLKAEGVELSEGQARRLVASIARGQEEGAELFFDELAGESFEASLQQIAAEARAARQQEEMRWQQQAQQEAAAQAREGDRFRSDDMLDEGVGNDDRSTGTRILAALAYMLTLADGLQLIVPLLQSFPALAVPLLPIVVVSAIINAIPFGSLIFFVAFISLAQFKDVPRLIRFNLEQAVLLDVAQIVPNLIITILSYFGGAAFVPVVGVGAFLALFAVVAYCVFTTLQGKEPDGIPIISKTTKNVIDRSSFFDK